MLINRARKIARVFRFAELFLGVITGFFVIITVGCVKCARGIYQLYSVIELGICRLCIGEGGKECIIAFKIDFSLIFVPSLIQYISII